MVTRLVLALLLTAVSIANAEVRVESATPCAQYGAEKLKAAVEQAHVAAPVRIVVDPAAGAKAEGFRITPDDKGIVIAGHDDAGAMYGCLELARRARDDGKLPEKLDVTDAPAMSLRGTCILLMKLGLYDYPVTPKEFPFFYDKALWTQYLDFLAENRFNYIAFWNGHPFDYFVKLDKYPEAQDGLEPGLLERNHEMLMWLGQEAQRRNIWLMFEFYNIHVSVYFAKAHNLPEHGIGKPTPLLRDYTGYCIERFVSEFPSVGLYICPGESLEMDRTPEWINDVIFTAVKRTGKTPPIMVRSWGIDLEHMKKVVGNYPRLYTERKFNVEMIADTRIDPENADWAKLSGNHVVNIHCMGNLEPFRWSPPDYIRQCVKSSVDAGATGLHLYPRKAWRWPYGCDIEPKDQLQWERDWMWFEAWGRYAWNVNRDADEDSRYWIDRLTKRFGTEESARRLLESMAAGADVLPAIQRLLWIGNDNHNVVSAGATLEQLQKAKGIPFLDMPGVHRIPDFIDALKNDKNTENGSPCQFLEDKWAAAVEAARLMEIGAAAATLNKDEAARIVMDACAVALVAQFYRLKVQAAIEKAMVDANIDAPHRAALCRTTLKRSVECFSELTDLCKTAYESLSDVPAWNPARELPCPYHWSDILPLYEKEYARVDKELKKKFPRMVRDR
jgi:hypothetical protein